MNRTSRLLFIMPGPLWEIKDTLRKRMARLSERYEGAILTSMPDGLPEGDGSAWATSP